MNVSEPAIQAIPTGFDGLVILQPRVFTDHRGLFVKTFHEPLFRKLGIPFQPREEFYSISARHVLRGMHFQRPPEAHAKLVYCLSGRVLDVALDLRRQSATYGRAFARELHPANRELLFLPAGFAHGFLALEDNSLVVYLTDTVHSPAHDAGIAWDSFGFDWPVANPILSERDRKFPAWSEFDSPF
jgi:dTDP-4-dehydrorhamnose 3,5-epimerase